VTILFVGPLALTLISWSCSWMIGTARTAVQRFGWMLSAAILAPGSAAYAAATGQWPYVAANLVFAVIAVRGYRNIRNTLERSTRDAAVECNGCSDCIGCDAADPGCSAVQQQCSTEQAGAE
jgi:hypothetical protein